MKMAAQSDGPLRQMRSAGAIEPPRREIERWSCHGNPPVRRTEKKGRNPPRHGAGLPQSLRPHFWLTVRPRSPTERPETTIRRLDGNDVTMVGSKRDVF